MKNVQNEIVRDLARAAAGYGQAGLAIVHKTTGHSNIPQVAIGNLSIAIELLLKAFIAKQSLLLFFKNLPLELRCVLAAPEAMPRSFHSVPFEVELKASTFKSLELDEAIATFGVFSPEFKKQFGSHLRFLSNHRNICVHAVHPDYREYEVDRTTFLFLSLVEFLRQKDTELASWIFLDNEEKNMEFLKRFDEERLNRVHQKIEAAKQKAKQVEKVMLYDPEEWDSYPVECPVCSSCAILWGETTAEPDYDRDYVPCGVCLYFIGETFECEHCGLSLDDYDEMKIAGVDAEYDRSDESDRWERDEYQDDYEYWM